MSTRQQNRLSQKYEIADPKEYKAASTAPGEPAIPAGTEKRLMAAPLETKETEIEKRAVWVVHGMGQQIPFETLDNLTEGLRSVVREPSGGAPRLRAVKFDNQIVQRVELTVIGASGKPYELHLYEAYWAPLTEGVAKLSDVISFLFDGALRGLLNAVKRFERAMFPGPQKVKTTTGVNPDENGIRDFRIPPRAVVEIVAVMLVLLSLIWINAIILAAGGAIQKLPILGQIDIQGQWNQFTALASGMCAVALTFGVILFLAEMSKPAELSNWKKKTLCLAGWIGFLITLATIIAAAGLMFALAAWKTAADWLAPIHVRQVQCAATMLILSSMILAGFAMLMRAYLRSEGSKLRGNGFLVFLFMVSFLIHLSCIPIFWYVSSVPLEPPAWAFPVLNWLANKVWVWPSLILLSAQVRTILVEFPGDVAIYITPNKLDRFERVRQEIKSLARVSAANVYKASVASGKLEYEKIAIVGHSLGSVIAYDTLNYLLTDDTLSGKPLSVAKRTCLLETFGSPLDKIAFFFSIQGKTSFHIREQLAALVQPLIQNYEDYRKCEWVNVYSPNDIISGSLKFYDLPEVPVPPHVKNLADDQAVVPLVAHVDYWKNKLVWQELYRVVAP